MPTTKDLQQLETYVRARKREGYQRADVIAKIKEQGYPDSARAVVDHIYQRHMIPWILLGIVVAAILVILVFFSSRSDPAHFFQQQITNRATLFGDPLACLDMPVSSDQKSCLSKVRSTIDAVLAEPANPSETYTRSVAFAAALRHDVALCSTLPSQLVKQCADAQPYLRANLESNPTLCFNLSDMNLQRTCFLDSLRHTDITQFARINQLMRGGVVVSRREGFLICL